MSRNENNWKLLSFLKPKKVTLILLFLLVLITSIIPNYFSYVTKNIWDEYHGALLTFLKLKGCVGPCGDEEMSRKYFLKEFNTISLLGNIFIWYFAACFIVFGISVLSHNEKIKAIVTRKR